MAINTENVFYKNRMKIKAISETNHVDAGVASSMYAKENGLTDDTKAINEWMNIMRHYQMDSKLTLADLFK